MRSTPFPLGRPPQTMAQYPSCRVGQWLQPLRFHCRSTCDSTRDCWHMIEQLPASSGPLLQGLTRWDTTSVQVRYPSLAIANATSSRYIYVLEATFRGVHARQIFDGEPTKWDHSCFFTWFVLSWRSRYHVFKFET